MKNWYDTAGAQERLHGTTARVLLFLQRFCAGETEVLLCMFRMDPAAVSSIVTGTVAIVAGLGGSALTTYFNRQNTTDTLAAARKTSEEQWTRTQEQTHAVWLREKKQQAYADFLTHPEALSVALNSSPLMPIDPPVTTRELAVKRGTIKLVGSPEVRSLAHKVEGALYIGIHNQELVSYSVGKDVETEDDETNRSDFLEAHRVAVVRTSALLAELIKAMRDDLATKTPDDGQTADHTLTHSLYPLFPPEMTEGFQEEQEIR